MNEAADGNADIWWICLRPEGDGPPMPIRVRRFLKSALRSYRLRCVCVTGKAPDGANGSHDYHLADVPKQPGGQGGVFLKRFAREPHMEQRKKSRPVENMGYSRRSESA